MKLRVQFAHGLEGSSQGAKARFFSSHFEASTPVMDTRDFEACVAVHRRAIDAFSPDVVVGSSFGGAVVIRLLADGVWRGPTLLLAPAPGAFGLEARIPEGVPVLIVHGLRDTVVDPKGSRILAQSGTPSLVRLVEVDDDHRLQTLVDSGRLADLVREVGQAAGS
jgi:alpha-beta hydrolase superfamily lysophospholipase